jgi:toxin FitB
LRNGYLLDTSIVSLLSPGRTEVSAEVLDWLRRNDFKTFLSTVTVFEISQGVERAARTGAIAKSEQYGLWLEGLVEIYRDRMIEVDIEIAMQAGRLSDHAISIGRHPGVADILIAATSSTRGMTLLTHNLRHFTPLDIDAIDPLVSLPG